MLDRIRIRLDAEINQSTLSFKGQCPDFKAINSPLITVLADSAIESVIPGLFLTDSNDRGFVVVAARTVAAHMELTLYPVPSIY
jgi:hypothetical protein